VVSVTKELCSNCVVKTVNNTEVIPSEPFQCVTWWNMTNNVYLEQTKTQKLLKTLISI